MRKEGDTRRPDNAIARIAANQHGVLTAAQLADAGLSPAGIDRRLRAGRLHRIHRGVYSVGHSRLSDAGRWMAAVLASGPGAVLSHISAAELWEIHRRRRRPIISGGGQDSVHVTVPGRSGKRKRSGIALHRSPSLNASDCTRRNGIPVTKPGRTLEDLRHLVSPAQFAAALREAEFRRLPVGKAFTSDGARTELESRFLALCRRHRLPQPAVNSRVDRFVVDFLWSPARLIVEVDGWESHRSRTAFENDRSRDARLKLLGYEVLRFTWRQVTEDRRGVARTIRALLRRSP